MKKILILGFISFLLVLLNGCYTFTSFQNAKILSEGEGQLTANYSSVKYSSNSLSGDASNNLGFQIASGIGYNTELRLRYERINADYSESYNGWYLSASSDYHYFGVETKKGLQEDLIAASLPVGIFFGEGMEISETLQVHPSLIFTIPFNKNFEINLNPKYLIYLDEAQDNLFALNIGLGMSSDLDEWAIRPEFGYLINPGEDGHFSAYSVGFTLPDFWNE